MKKLILDDEYLSDRPLTLSEKIEESRQALRLAAEMSREYYNKPLVVTYSGGKDSDVMFHLAETTLKPHEFEVLNSHTTVDAPETVYHIRDTFNRLNRHGIKTRIDYHIGENGRPTTMWSLIPEKMLPPTRIVRYCCSVLKESGTPDRICTVGVREDESSKRQHRNLFSTRGGYVQGRSFFSLAHAEEVYRESREIQDEAWDCKLITTMKQNKDVVVNPIYHFTEQDIWEYIRREKIETNPLYQCGYSRVGCIGCPLATYQMRVKEFSDYPKYRNLYIKAFDRMLIVREKRGKSNKTWRDGRDVFDFWIEEYKHNVKGQITIDEWLNAEEVRNERI